VEVIAVAAGALLLIGFICGYGVRELISRHRRAEARRRRFECAAEEIAQTRKLITAQPEARLAIGFRSRDGAPTPPDGGPS
jgi:NADH:ubiquinone oxidoreductase subunit 3 (subunit A)